MHSVYRMRAEPTVYRQSQTESRLRSVLNDLLPASRDPNNPSSRQDQAKLFRSASAIRTRPNAGELGRATNNLDQLGSVRRILWLRME
jgi:hypothetical protein